MGDARRKYETRQDAYEAHKKRVREWQERNYDKVKTYAKTYGQKDEIREKNRLIYQNLSQERKNEIMARNRINYHKRRAEIEKDPVALEALRAEQRSKYHELTPEQKYELNEKRKAFNARKKAEHEHTDS
jgi:hypothetical protein